MENNDYTLIEKYLAGELGEAEQDAFRLRLKEDQTFAEAYKTQKSMNIFLEKSRNQPSLESKLEKIGADFFLEEKKEEAKVVSFRKSFIIAFTSAAAVAMFIILWNPFSSSSTYDQYASHLPLSLTEKSTSSDAATKAENNFNEKKYDQAYIDLTTYLQENKEDQKARLALGISALETGKTAEAIDLFTQIKNGGSSLKNYGTWYLALTYLKEKDDAKAKTFLMQIPESEKTLFKNAEEILKGM